MTVTVSAIDPSDTLSYVTWSAKVPPVELSSSSFSGPLGNTTSFGTRASRYGSNGTTDVTADLSRLQEQARSIKHSTPST